jgi:phospholipid/cholesterol/gamma-HCH transport system permease protein
MNVVIDHIRSLIRSIGTIVLEQVTIVGRLTVLLFQIVYWGFKGTLKWRLVLEQFNEIGVNSLPVIIICSQFAGMVLVVQVGKQFASLNAEKFIGGTVGLSLARELAPLISAVVVAGRNGSAMAAEIGTMKVTEQIDALIVLSTNPVYYLVVPRVIACMVMVPVLTVFSNIVGILGGALVAVTQVGITMNLYFNSVVDQVTITDFVSGCMKAIVFGVIIGVIACYKGLTCEGGAEGVGRATTGSVVFIITMLLISNYFLSSLFFTYQQSITQ